MFQIETGRKFHCSPDLCDKMVKEDLKTPRTASDAMTVSSVDASAATVVETWAIEVPEGQSSLPTAAFLALQQAEKEGPHVALLFITVIETSQEKEPPARSANGDFDRLALTDLESDEWEHEREREREREVTTMLEHLVATASQKHVRAKFLRLRCSFSNSYISVRLPPVWLLSLFNTCCHGQ